MAQMHRHIQGCEDEARSCLERRHPYVSSSSALISHVFPLSLFLSSFPRVCSFRVLFSLTPPPLPLLFVFSSEACAALCHTVTTSTSLSSSLILALPIYPPPPYSSPVLLIAKSMLIVREQCVSGRASEHGYPLPPLPGNLCVYVHVCVFPPPHHTQIHILPSVPSQPVLKYMHQAR